MRNVSAFPGRWPDMGVRVRGFIGGLAAAVLAAMLAIAPAAVVGVRAQASVAPSRHVVHHDPVLVALPGSKFGHLLDRHDVDATPPESAATTTTRFAGLASVVSYGEPRPGHTSATSRGPPTGAVV